MVLATRRGTVGAKRNVTRIASANLDRLFHHSQVLTIRGASHRVRGKKRAGLFGTNAAAAERRPATP